jgi:hypothetical protein
MTTGPGRALNPRVRVSSPRRRTRDKALARRFSPVWSPFMSIVDGCVLLVCSGAVGIGLAPDGQDGTHGTAGASGAMLPKPIDAPRCRPDGWRVRLTISARRCSTSITGWNRRRWKSCSSAGVRQVRTSRISSIIVRIACMARRHQDEIDLIAGCAVHQQRAQGISL